MKKITPKISQSVSRREKFLQDEFRKTLKDGNYGKNAEKKKRILSLIGDLNDRYGYEVVSYSNPFVGLTKDNITSNGKYSLD